MTAILTAAQRDSFLDHLIETDSVAEAARRAGISVRDAWEQRETNRRFFYQWQLAEVEVLRHLVYRARCRAIEGVERPLTSRGAMIRNPDGSIATVREYNENLLMFLVGMEG